MLLFKVNYTIYLLMLPYHHVLGLVLDSYLSSQTRNPNLFPRVICHLLLKSQPSADSPLFLEVGLWHCAHHLSLDTNARERISTCLNHVMNASLYVQYFLYVVKVPQRTLVS